MSRSIASNILEKLATNEITTFYLLKFTVDGTTYRYTDCEKDLYSAADGTSELYITTNFEFDPVTYTNGEIVDSCNIRIDNLNSVMSSIFLDNVIAESPVILYIIILNDNNTILNTQQIFNGLINDFKLDETEIIVTMTSIFAKWNQNSNITQSSLCRWKVFKGTECGYASSETKCDRTYSRCVELSNTDNYGGFRWVAGIEDKQIQWGPLPAQTRR